MKILEIAPPWIDIPPKGYGGTEWIIWDLAEGFTRKGHDVTLFATKDSKTSAKLKYVFPKGLANEGTPWEAALPALIHYDQALIDSDQYDLIHFHLSSQTDLVAFPFIPKLSCAHAMTIHGHWPYDVFSDMDKYFKKIYGSQIDIISISKFMESSLPKGFHPSGYVHNALDTTHFKFQPNPQNYYAWLGKFDPEKGALEAIKVAKATNTKIKIAGIYKKNLPAQYHCFTSKIEPLLDQDLVEFIGEADLQMKVDLLRNAKAFLNPISWEEPFGLVMIEAMACGTPVISFNRGAAPELIIDGQTGFLVDTLKEMIKATERISHIDRKFCHDHVKQNFSLERMTDDYLLKFEKLIKNYSEK